MKITKKRTKKRTKKESNKISYKIFKTLNFLTNPLFAVLPLAIIITLLALWCQPIDFGDIMKSFGEKPILILLNFLPIAIFLLCCTFLTRNVFIGGAVANFFIGVLSIANRIKIQIRDEPVFPRDWALLREVGSAMNHYHIEMPVRMIAVIFFLTLALAVAGVFIGALPWDWRGQLIGIAASFVALALLIILLGSTTLYDSLSVSNPYRLSVVFNENGFPYNFCHQFTTYLVDRPKDYNKAEAILWDNGEDQKRHIDLSAIKDINVIMVMNEAFSDITNNPVFDFSDDNDPLGFLHAMQKDVNSLSLRLVVPGFAGGTANTEFDVLTGMQTNALGSSTTSAMRTVNRNLDSVFRVFAEDSYRTSFFHPGDDWFYNRENVYKWLGAEKTAFIDQMEDPQYLGRWVTDNYLARVIEGEFVASVNEGRPLFHYSTTIQNHMSYDRSKYGEDYEYEHVPLNITVSDEVQEILDVYVSGVRDADAMLGELYRFFYGRNEPVLLVFFGDHLPYLGEDKLVYDALGMDIAKEDEDRENYFSVYETPCIIWANNAAASKLGWYVEEEIDSSENTDEENMDNTTEQDNPEIERENAIQSMLDKRWGALGLAENGKLSAAFLGALILELTGRGEYTPWFSFLNSLRREAPVIQGDVYMLPDGFVINAADSDEQLSAEIQKWRQWSYYKLEQKKLIAG